MPELSDLIGDKCWVSVEIRGSTVQVAYRPESTSFRKQAQIRRRMRELQEQVNPDEMQQVDDVGALFCEIVCDWDLTQNGRHLPVTPETVTALPEFIRNAIMSAINADRQSESDEKKVSSVRSGAGLPVEAKLEIAPNGTPSSERPGTWG